MKKAVRDGILSGKSWCLEWHESIQLTLWVKSARGHYVFKYEGSDHWKITECCRGNRGRVISTAQITDSSMWPRASESELGHFRKLLEAGMKTADLYENQALSVEENRERLEEFTKSHKLFSSWSSKSPSPASQLQKDVPGLPPPKVEAGQECIRPDALDNGSVP